jgi:glycosyltransferase involved in cell wall biosynthesis
VLDLVLVPLRALLRGYDLVVTLANFGPVWCPVPHVVFQRNVMPFSEEYLGRVRGRQRIEWRFRGWLCYGEMRFATFNVTPSEAMAGDIRRAYPSLRRKPFRVLFHATDLSRFGPRDTSGEARSDPFVFLCPTRVEVYKGLDVLIEATRRLAEARDDFTVQVTADDTGWPDTIQQAIDGARHEPFFERLHFLGPQSPDRMPDVYRAADAVVHPSLCESFGFPLLEAMACGLPIVAGDMEINRELGRDAALYYELTSAAACADAMRRVLDDPACRDRLRASALARIRERDWSWDAYAARFVELCEAALAPRSSG